MPTDTTSKTKATQRHSKVLTGLTAILVAGTLGACSHDPGPVDMAATEPIGRTSEHVRERLDAIVDAGYPAAIASVTVPGSDPIHVAAGVGNTNTGAAPPTDGEVRIASNTKMFVATVVMQLVEEGLIALDAPIDTYLPGLVEGQGIDGTAITVRHLLQHTAGLPEYADKVAEDAFGAQNTYIAPRDLLDTALAEPAVFAPGSSWEYSNTNYLVLGLLIERVTERVLAEQIDQRIVRPLGLQHTYLPNPGERELRGPHADGYHADYPDDLREISDLDPSFAWAAGAMVSTPSELGAFMKALLFEGELVDDNSLAQMQNGVASGDELYPEAKYGLGLQSYPLSCGGIAWGHGGDIPGTQTRNAVGPDGTAVTIAVTALPFAIVDSDDENTLIDYYRIVLDALDATLCDR
ncbi:serine hydrolase domain-containing protein [Rhodococcus sp. KRD197]|jgi:D-alanyl-D-alanine carboxypeptidase|uniref:serine hydrolase domain-containing protein n=1 Tax=unclassified Rhodococcus (in: high G+C Gram-positive bacteria) TaxID=192944 RepID=UPI001F497EEA|nr:beta-lactamase family protein [Rhodococcus sp. KRD197]